MRWHRTSSAFDLLAAIREALRSRGVQSLTDSIVSFARKIGKSRSVAYARLLALEQAGLIRRFKPPGVTVNHRQATAIALTQEGRRVLFINHKLDEAEGKALRRELCRRNKR